MKTIEPGRVEIPLEQKDGMEMWKNSGALHLLMLVGLCFLLFVLNTAVWKVGP